MVKPKTHYFRKIVFCAKCIKNGIFKKKCLRPLTFDAGVCNN